MAQGGMSVQNTSIQTTEMMDVVYQPETFLDLADTTYRYGLVLARLTASGKVVPWVDGGSLGAEIPVGVLGTTLTTGPGPADESIEMIVSGQVDQATLFELAAPTTPLTQVQKDLLRDFGIVPIDTVDLSKLDNQ